MTHLPVSHISQDVERLGALAMQFRGTRDRATRRLIARDYADTIGRLVASNQWDEMPPPEDQLPDTDMPATFAEYWQRLATARASLSTAPPPAPRLRPT